MLSRATILLLCWNAALLSPPLSAQIQPVPFAIQYTTADGLPSSEVYVALEDSRGYIWFGTDNGVVRYDGYDFVTYGPNEGLEDPVVFTIVEGPEGDVYACSGLSRQVFVWSPLTNRFRGHAINAHASENFQQLQGYILRLYTVLADGSLSLGIPNFGPIHFSCDEELLSMPVIEDFSQEDLSLYHYAVTVKKTYIPSHPIRDLNRKVAKGSGQLKNGKTRLYQNFISLDGDAVAQQELDLPPSRGYSRGLFSFIHIANGDSNLVSIHNRIAYIENCKSKRQQVFTNEFDRANFIYCFPSGGILTGHSKGVGMTYFASLSDFSVGRSVTFLDDCNASYAIEDKKKGLWVTTLDKGIFYFPSPEVGVFDERQGFPGTKNISVLVFEPNRLITGYETNETYLVSLLPDNGISKDSEYLGTSQPISYFYHSRTKRIFFRRSVFDLKTNEYQILKSSYKYTSEEGENTFYVIDSKKLSSLNGDTLLAATYFGPGLYNVRSEEVVVEGSTVDLSLNEGRVRVNDYKVTAEGAHLVASNEGLYSYLNFDTLIRENFGFEELDHRIEAIEVLPDESILFGSRGHGILRLKDGDLTIIGKAEGLASDMVRHLEVAPDNSIWVSTFNGVSHVQFRDLTPEAFSDQTEKPYAVHSYNMAHGLPSNEVHQTSVAGDHVWLATSGGLTNFVSPARDTIPSIPSIRQLKVNGEERALSPFFRLSPEENNLEITFSTINFKMGGEIAYRYRLNSYAPWIHTSLRSVNLTAHPAGDYQFSVQSQNEDGYWSEAASLSFSIAPYWYERLIIQVVGVLLLMAFLAFILLRRQKRILQREELRQQIAELEQAALRAQMNPHFTFNCLNSINKYILKNEAEEASLYLTKFAKLIRQTLNISVEEEHTLQDEIAMLENYLALEKLRFKDRVNYEIAVSPDLDPISIQVPPLLIQPFVENALIHGVSESAEGGRVDVTFDPCPSGVKVNIIDNGVGYTPETSEQKRKSWGMRITRQRLALMATSKDAAEVKIRSLQESDGNQQGTSVEIIINTGA